MSAALSHIKVLDLTRILAGPWSTQILADFGADVIKVERPGSGDDTRCWGPPYVRDESGEDTAESAYFQCANRGKRSVCIDIQSEQGQETLKRLVREADVLVENFKVGGAAQYGLDYESLQAINSRLIYCSITGFGQTGPYAERLGYDFMIQAMGGLMSITGEKDGRPGAGPQKIGVALTDVMTGLYATIGILTALAERDKSGRGQYIDLALLDVTAATLANQATNYLVGDRVPQRLGNAHPNIVPYQAFKASDAYLVIAVGNDGQFARFCELMNQSAWAQDPRFATNPQRVAHREELIPLIEAVIASKSRDFWLPLLEQAQVPASPINSIDEVFQHEQILARGMRVEVEHPLAGTVSVAGNPIKMSRTPAQYERHPPLLGEHTEEVLAEIAD